MKSTNHHHDNLTPTLEDCIEFFRSEFNTEVHVDRDRQLLIVESRTPYGDNPLVLRRKVHRGVLVLQVDIWGIARLDKAIIESQLDLISQMNACGIPGVVLPMSEDVTFRQYVAVKHGKDECWQDSLRYMLVDGLNLSALLHACLSGHARHYADAISTAASAVENFNFDSHLN